MAALAVAVIPAQTQPLILAAVGAQMAAVEHLAS
jgi:hypothetical protein